METRRREKVSKIKKRLLENEVLKISRKPQGWPICKRVFSLFGINPILSVALPPALDHYTVLNI